MVAQDYFFSFVGGWRNNVGLEHNQDYQVIGLETVGQPGQNGLILNHLFDDGSVSSQISFSIDTLNSIDIWDVSSSSLWIDDNTLLMPGRTSTGITNEGGLFRFDAESQVIDLYSSYNFDILTVFFCIEGYSDTSFIVLSRETETGMFTRSYVHCINNDGTVQWSSEEMSTGQAWNYTRPQDILRLTSGQIAVLIWEHDTNQPAFHDRWRARLSLLDDTGAVLWTRYPGDHENYRIRPGGIVEQDGDILVAFSDPYYYDETGEWQPSANKVRLERYNQTGTLVMEDSLIVNPPDLPAHWVVSQVLKTSDDNFIIAGYHDLRHGFLAKITPEYETIWFERYSPYEYEEGQIPDFSTQILNTIETSDGGFLCTGMFFADPGSEPHPSGLQTAIALKVDEFGCLVENCSLGLSEFQVQDSRLELWPNPVSTGLNVRIPRGIAVDQVTLVDAMGRVIEDSRFQIQGSQSDNLESLSLNLESLPAGLYTIIMTSDEGGLYSGKFMKE